MVRTTAANRPKRVEIPRPAAAHASILSDFSDVIGPKLKYTKTGAEIISSIIRLVRDRGTQDFSAFSEKDLNEALLKKHDTDALHIAAMRECGMSHEELFDLTYNPMLNALGSELSGWKAHAGLLRKSEVPIAILSNSALPYIDAFLKANHMLDVFTHVITPEAIDGMTKPSEEAYLRAISITGFDPSGTIFIDNRMKNLVYPRSMGMTTVYIGNDPPAEYVCHHFSNRREAFEAILRMCAGT